MTEYQRDEGMSDEAMAAKIGVPRPTWTAARNGRFRPALGFLRKVAAVPEFRQQARAILIPPVRVAR